MLRAAFNEISFVLRSKLRRAPRKFREPELDPQLLPSFARAMIASERAADLTARYRLEPLSKSALYLGTLFLIDLFDQLYAGKPEYFSPLKGELKVLDVGARDFEAAPAIYHALKYRGLEPSLTGIEVDGCRLTASGTTCRDAGLARCAALPGRHRYLVEDVFEHRDRYQMIVWIHPFLDEERLLEWGLPRRFLQPRKMLEHVLSLLEPGGLLMIVNQEKSEREQQRALFDALGTKYQSIDVPLYFRARDEPAYVHLFSST
jgi:hypothetical protein